jgi:hypothetical protein
MFENINSNDVFHERPCFEGNLFEKDTSNGGCSKHSLLLQSVFKKAVFFLKTFGYTQELFEQYI